MPLFINNISLTGDCSNTGSGAFTVDFFTTDPGPPYSLLLNFISPFSSAITLTTLSYTLTGLTGGSYSFTITDSSGTLPEVIYISTGTCVSITDIDHTTCNSDNGALTASTTYSVNTGATYYLYETTYGIVQSGTSLTDYVFTNLSAGTYYVVAEDGGGCTGKSESCIVKSSSTLTFGLYAVPDGSCGATTDNGKIFITGITGTPPYSYVWSPGGQTTQNVTGLTGGQSYSVIVTDNSGCSQGNSVFVPQASPLGFVTYTSSQPNCFSSDGQITVYISGGTPPYFYSGNNGSTAVSFGTSYTFTGLSSGNYQFYILDSGLCNITTPVSPLTTPNQFGSVTTVVTNSTCNNSAGQIQVTVNNGPPAGAQYIYQLTSGTTTYYNSTQGSSTTITGLSSGTYTLEVYLQSSPLCVFTQTVVVNNVDLFTISASTTGTTCNLSNGGVLITVIGGGTPNFTYQINPLSSPSFYSPVSVLDANTSKLFTGLPSGNYLAGVTDSTGCYQTIPFTIAPSSEVLVTLVSTPTVVGNDGTVTAFITSGTPPFTLNWSSNVGAQTGYYMTNLTAGTYTLTVTDYYGCTFTQQADVKGFTLFNSTEVYNICDTDLTFGGLVIQKGPKQMLVEGYFDLTTNDINCVLNKAVFSAQVTIGDLTKTQPFYTGTTLDEYPTYEEWYDVLDKIIMSFDGIGSVTINPEKNEVKITTSCDPNAPSLTDSQVIINMVINYDISCVACFT